MLDASVAAAWYVARQSTPATIRLLSEARRHTWRAPYCFAWETPNVLLAQEHRGSLASGVTEEIMDDLALVIGVKGEPPPSEAQGIYALHFARKHRISLFDGFYLLLALERDEALVTRDQGLAAAAQAESCDFDYVGPAP